MKCLFIPPLTSALLLMLAGTFTIVHPAVELAKASPTPANTAGGQAVSQAQAAAEFEQPFAPTVRFAEQPAVPIAFVADPKPEPPPDQQVTLPELPLPPVPPPPPPSTVTKLSAGQLYVITSIQKVLVLGSRDGFVKISSPKTPCTLYGNFVDAKPTDDEGRTYSSGFVYVVKAAATGQVELIVVTDLSGKGLIRRTLDVDNGTPPVPPTPPGPTPPVPPTPTPDAVLLKALTDAYAKDTADPDRAANVVKLAAVYRQAAKVTALDPAFKTVKDIDAAIRLATQGTIGVLSLPNTRDAVGVWLRSQLPTKADTPLDDALRQKYVAAWTALATALDKVK